jgi:8-oxo-dGTP pyrophosphatase MutT (NUDIX family)
MKYVACGIMYHNDKILMGKRALSSDSPGIWEFPGGKLEKGLNNHTNKLNQPL